MIKIGLKFVQRGWVSGKPRKSNSKLRTLNSELKKQQISSIAGYFPIVLFLLSLLCFPVGCAHLSSDLGPENVAPFFHIQTDPEKQSRRLDAGGPFYSQAEGPEEREWTLRPFFSYRENLKEQTEELEYLYPIGWYKKTPEGTLKRLIPFFSSFKSAPDQEEEGKEEHTDLFLVFWGKDKAGESYGGVFPFGGLFKDRFDRDEIQFVLWPLLHPDPGRGNTNVQYPLADFFPDFGRNA